ncbi:phospholipase A2 inhibitor and Ly6/PLAUR domain-containing protein-like isoform X1 [Gopherus flavomarginatus]|uniref:phospholipase A2 inhibitor and Ly6/PLAUR domain-containing protein-like isoform X1 n=1 Tax=Gopherus flavomarginatus TaxID=286002 RepID=UPI0021CC415E|nr:phospholipase A2 inhibitor and Ly6/PLAUR domain-containing protein-like isoform X1 [Gopherus flavomarginatus]XP_050784578.1 phospholipase A2 inhibitor and Ly6/PLAUR domain-containing protein-like isoform X1 [Gopherus flavomarginatus]
MKAPFFLCILFALLGLGACLQCEVCSEFGRDCRGSMETCSSGEDSCAITVFETLIVGLDIQKVIKSCMASSECRASPVVTRFGEGMAIRKSTTCCVGDACSTASVTMPPASTIPNGRHCPACSSVFNFPCSKETLACTGSETHCIAVTGSITMVLFPVQITMKGCATESVCTHLKGDSGIFGDNIDLSTATCRPAPGKSEPTKGPAPGESGTAKGPAPSVTSPIKGPAPSTSGTAKGPASGAASQTRGPALFAAGTTPGPSGLLLLPVLTGLFLLKLLS